VNRRSEDIQLLCPQLACRPRVGAVGGGWEVNSVAAIFVREIGSVYHPLQVGEHTLVISVESPLGNFQSTYHITVSP
jgi:hypothetical protein